MRHTNAINLLKRELDSLTSKMIPMEQQIADLCNQLEEMKFEQLELMESIKELGAANAATESESATG